MKQITPALPTIRPELPLAALYKMLADNEDALAVLDAAFLVPCGEARLSAESYGQGPVGLWYKLARSSRRVRTK